MRFRMILMAAILAGLFLVLSASAQVACDNPKTLEFTAVVPVQGISYDTSVDIPAFDTSLGDLQSVKLTAQACGWIDTKVDSEDVSPRVFRIVSQATGIVTLPDNSELLSKFGTSDAGLSVLLGADDEPGINNADFAGPDFVEITNGTPDNNICGPIVATTPPLEGAAIEPFKGGPSDVITLPVSATGDADTPGSLARAIIGAGEVGVTITVVYTYCAPVIEKFCINGTKINDCTADPIQGWQICVSNSSGYRACVLTDAAGEYSFCGLMPGDYQVTEETRAGWVSKDATVRDVTLGPDADDVNFINAPLSCISGHKFNSKTNAGLSGWTINLEDASGRVIKTTTTGTGGLYQFCNLLPGSYTVCEVQKAGWKADGPTCINVVLEECENSENNDFLNEPVTQVCVCPFFIKNELYTASCHGVFEVPASKGILANDPAGSIVLHPELITIPAQYGTITVEEDGSFVYDPTGATGLHNGVYVIFNYSANNGQCDSKYLGIAKIQVSCK